LKGSFIYVFFLSVLIYLSSLYDPLISFIATLPFTRKRTGIIEVLVSFISFLVLSFFHRETFFSFTLRAISLINLYFMSSQLTDLKSIIDITKGKATPVIVAMAYYPFFYETTLEITTYARARGIKLYRVDKLLLPIVVLIVKTAEDLYTTVTLKLSGKYRGNFDIMPRRNDIIIIAYGVVILCLSLSLRF